MRLKSYLSWRSFNFMNSGEAVAAIQAAGLRGRLLRAAEALTIMTKTPMTTAALVLSVVSSAHAETAHYVSSAFVAHGYREHTKTGQRQISIHASMAEGVSQLNVKTLYDALIEIEVADFKLVFKGTEALAKTNEIIVEGKSAVKVFSETVSAGKAEFGSKPSSKFKGPLFSISARAPEQVIRFDVDQFTLQIPSARVETKGKVYEGRGIIVRLRQNEITWVQNVKREGGEKLKTPFTLKFR